MAAVREVVFKELQYELMFIYEQFHKGLGWLLIVRCGTMYGKSAIPTTLPFAGKQKVKMVLP